MTIPRVGFLGPTGSFSHEAVTLLGHCEPVARGSIADVLAGVADGSLDEGLVPLENALEGTVSATIDGLVFDHDLVIVEEVILPIHMHLLARRGVTLQQITHVSSYGHALAQVRGFIATLPNVTIVETTSTSQAASNVASSSDAWAAVGSALAAELFDLEIIADDIADNASNATRFVRIGRRSIAGPTGNDRTLLVCFQDADRPGSLYGILGRFAARDINLTKLESRPTKTGLGDYCFVIECDGHIADDLIADCLADVQAHLATVKFLGSYPVTGDVAHERRTIVGDARRSADAWVQELRARIER